MCQLPQLAAIHADRIDVVVILYVLTHGKDNGVTVEVELDVTCDPLGNGENRPDVTRSQVNRLDGSRSDKAVRIALIVLKHGFRRMVIRTILGTLDVQDRVLGYERISQQRATLESREFSTYRIELVGRGVFSSALQVAQRCEKLGRPDNVGRMSPPDHGSRRQGRCTHKTVDHNRLAA